MAGFHLKKGKEKMFNKRLLKTFKTEMKNVYRLVGRSMADFNMSYFTYIFT